MVAYAALIAATVGLFAITPTGFIPAQDQGYFLTVIQLPPGSSLDRTDAVMRKVAARILPIPGVKGAVMLAGFDGASQTQAPNAAAAYIPLQVVRGAQKARRHASRSIMAEAQKRTADINEARLIIVPPPLIQGIGSAGGYRMIVEDRDRPQLPGTVRAVMGSDRQGEPDARASSRSTPCSTSRRRACSPTSIARRPRCSGCRRSACSKHCRSISARRSSTTSTCSAAPIA